MMTRSYPHDAWAKMMARSPGVWYSLMVGQPGHDGHMKVMAYRIRRGTLHAYRPAGSYDAMYRNGVLWAQKVEEPHDQS